MFKLRRFIKTEVDYLKDNCNFTEDEVTVFDMKCRDASDVQIAMAMNISDRTVSELTQRVKIKILKVAIS